MGDGGHRARRSLRNRSGMERRVHPARGGPARAVPFLDSPGARRTGRSRRPALFRARIRHGVRHGRPACAVLAAYRAAARRGRCRLGLYGRRRLRHVRDRRRGFVRLRRAGAAAGARASYRHRSRQRGLHLARRGRDVHPARVYTRPVAGRHRAEVSARAAAADGAADGAVGARGLFHCAVSRRVARLDHVPAWGGNGGPAGGRARRDAAVVQSYVPLSDRPADERRARGSWPRAPRRAARRRQR